MDKFPLYGPDNMPTDQYGLFRSDTGYIEGVKSISSRYVPHSTDDVCALVEAAASSLFDGEVECKTHWNRGHYVSIKPTQDRRVSIYGTKDNIFPAVIIRGGFDGKGFHGTMGLFRDACQNLEMMRRVAGANVTIRHSSGLRDRMNYLIDTFGNLQEGWENTIAAAKTMEDRKVNFEQFIAETFAANAPSESDFQACEADPNLKIRSVSTWKKRVEAITKRVKHELQSTRDTVVDAGQPVGEVSAWLAFNAVQGYYQHDAQAKQGFKSSFAKVLRAANETPVRIAEELAIGA
ncbi:MAG: DUF932 domain-containing protein [Planctomycetota bacterium]